VEALEAAGTKIVVIGCGEWNPIKSYAGVLVSLSVVSSHLTSSKKLPNSRVNSSPIQLVHCITL
jgi:hypothetical protein